MPDAGPRDERTIVLWIGLAFLFVLFADTMFGWVLAPYLDGGSDDTRVSDVLTLIVRGSPERLPLDSWEPMMTAFTWLHQHARENVYDAVFFVQHVKFQYPLTSLLPMEVLSAVGLLHVRVYALINLLMVLATAAGMGLLMVDLAKRFGLHRPDRNRGMGLMLSGFGVIATLCFYPVTKAFAVGQIQVWLNAAFVFASLSLLRDRRWLAGALLGASALIKPQMSLFLLWALLRKEWRFVAGWAAVVGPGVAVAIVLYGAGPFLHYLDVLSFIGRRGESYYSNQSVNGLFNRLLHNGPSGMETSVDGADWRGSGFAPYHPLIHAATLLSGALFFLFGLLWRLKGGPRERMTSFLVAGICFTIGAPVSWIPHYGVLLPAFAFALFILLGRLRLNGGDGRWGLLVLGFLFAITSNDIVQPFIAQGPVALNLLQSYLFL